MPDAPTPDGVLAELSRVDPGSVEALNGHLEYADRLISTDDPDCEQRLSLAESELDMAGADPSFDVVLPLGVARLADLHYRLHAARASCKAPAPRRQVELQQALEAAQQSVVLYRGALDYQAMTVAQFNVAVIQRLLGDDSAAAASLQSAIAMDQEFGLRQDAVDNAALLGHWRADSAAGSPAVATNAPAAVSSTATITPTVAGAGATADDIPVRTVTLKAWTPSPAQVTVQVDEVSVFDGNRTHGRAERTFVQQVRKAFGNWLVSYTPGPVVYDTSSWPEDIDAARELAESFERGIGFPGFQADSKGNFQSVARLQSFSSGQLSAARTLLLNHLGSKQGDAHLDFTQTQILQIAFHPTTIAADTAEDFNLRIGMWGGATLEQGAWYKLATPLTLPGARQMRIPYDVEFSYTRDVPCSAAASQHPCVELVVHAKPQAEAIEDFALGVDYPGRGRTHYWTTTYIRIVTDPETLATREYDVRRYWHISDNLATRGRVEDRAERIVTTYTYP